MIDTHAHIHDPQFDADRKATLQRAWDAGVEKLITVGTSVSESRDALACAQRYDSIFVAVAIHPHEYSKFPSVGTMQEWMGEIGKLSNDPKVVAIGECGLDYHAFGGVAVTEEQKEIQKSGFREHLELARRVGKPIVIHARESYGDVLEIIRDSVATIPAVILHCYQGDLDMTWKFLDLDERIAFSFAGNITYPVKKSFAGTKGDIQESIRVIPLDRILTETDCPYLTPQTFRGTRNEPSYVAEVVRKIAELKNVSFEEVERVTEGNAKRCFPGMFLE